MDDDDSESTVLNIRVPQALKERIDATYADFGYQNRSEFVRSVLRDALETSSPSEQTTARSSLSPDTDGAVDGHKQAEPPDDEPVNRLLKGGESSPKSEHTVAVVGCGNVGGQIIDRITRIRTTSSKTILVDTNKQDLSQHQADTKVLIGRSITHGLGAGGNPDIGRRAAEDATHVIADELGTVDVVFVAAGMGGGTGTGASPVIAQIARDHGATVIGMVTQPHRLEPEAVQTARDGITTLQGAADGTLICDITVAAEEILNTGAGEALTALTQLYANVITQLSSAIADENNSGLSLAALRSTFAGGTAGTVLFTETDTEADPKEIAITAIENSCYPDDITQATTGLLCIDSASITSTTAESIQTVFSEYFANATLQMTHAHTNGLDGYATVYMLLSGIEQRQTSEGQHATLDLSTDEAVFYDAIVSHSSVELKHQQAETIAQELHERIQQMDLNWDDRDAARTDIEMEIKSVLVNNDVPLSDHADLVDRLVSQVTPVA